MIARPLYFGPEDRRLFGWVHGPDDGYAAGAVVLCPPLARELNSAQGTFRHLAERFAEAGMLAIRFDYDGTGDSVGSDNDPERVRAWTRSVGHAIDLARACGARSVSLVGMRMGALLAAAASGIGEIESVVLWDPCPSGRAFVREQSALLRMVSDEPAESVEGSALLGFVFSAETVRDLGALAVPADRCPPSRTLLLTRPNREPAHELARSLGAPVTAGVALDQDQLLEVDPLLRRIPSETMDRLVAWVRGSQSRAPFHLPGSEEATIEMDGASVRERVLRLGPAGLFGIVTEPECPSSSPTALFLNAGLDSHIGPNRLWVEMARRWAAAGVRCVRFDLSGIGDSPTRSGRSPEVVRSPDAFDDLTDVRAAIGRGDPGNVILVGLCSGGYQALEEALAAPARAVYAINPVLHFAPPELADGPVDPRRLICRPTRGLSRAYRSLLAASLRRRLRPIAWRAARTFTLRRSRVARCWLRELRDEDVRVFVVCGEDQAQPFGPSAASGSSRPDDLVRIEVIPGLDGALMPAGQRTRVVEELTRDVIGRFAPPQLAVAARRGVA